MEMGASSDNDKVLRWAASLAAGKSSTIINRVVRTVLNRAARSYRDPDGRPWLEAMPPLITMLPENPRSP